MSACMVAPTSETGRAAIHSKALRADYVRVGGKDLPRILSVVLRTRECMLAQLPMCTLGDIGCRVLDAPWADAPMRHVDLDLAETRYKTSRMRIAYRLRTRASPIRDLPPWTEDLAPAVSREHAVHAVHWPLEARGPPARAEDLAPAVSREHAVHAVHWPLEAWRVSALGRYSGT